MALSEKAKDVIRVAMANNDEADQLIAEIDKVSAAGDVESIQSPDGSDAASTQTLANELKVKVDAIIAAMA